MTEQPQNTAGDLPDRAEEKRVDVPQNETPAPVESAQAPAATPTQEVTAENSGNQAQPTEDATGTTGDDATGTTTGA